MVTLNTDPIHLSQNASARRPADEVPDVAILVWHTANASSGRRVADLPVEKFLSINGARPEHSAVRATRPTLPPGNG